MNTFRFFRLTVATVDGIVEDIETVQGYEESWQEDVALGLGRMWAETFPDDIVMITHYPNGDAPS